MKKAEFRSQKSGVRISGAVLGLGGLLAAALAQQPARPPAQTPPALPGAQAATAEGGITKFSINSQLVIETVSVLDKNGKPIEGLKADDFKVTENGVAQTIKFCEFQKFQDDEPAGAPAAAAPAFPAPPKPTTPP